MLPQPMLSVLVLAGSDAMALVRSLAPLVPATVLGHVGTVSIACQSPSAEVRLLAQESGAALLDKATFEAAWTTFSAGATVRKAPILVLRAGHVLPEGWSEDAIAFLRDSGDAAVYAPQRPFGFLFRAALLRATGWAGTADHVLLAREPGFLTHNGAVVLVRRRARVLPSRFTIV
jgi:hypothetical protein